MRPAPFVCAGQGRTLGAKPRVERIPAAATSRCVFGGATRRKPDNSWTASMNIRTHEHAHLPRRRPDDDVRLVKARSLHVGVINGRARRLARTCPKEGLAERMGPWMVSPCAAWMASPTWVFVPPHLLVGPLDARTEARGGLATAESLRSWRSELGSCFRCGTRGRTHRRT